MFRTAILLFISLALPTAGAGGAIVLPVGEATVQDGFGNECELTAGTPCPYHAHLEKAPGEWEVDVYQNVE